MDKIQAERNNRLYPIDGRQVYWGCGRAFCAAVRITFGWDFGSMELGLKLFDTRKRAWHGIAWRNIPLYSFHMVDSQAQSPFYPAALGTYE